MYKYENDHVQSLSSQCPAGPKSWHEKNWHNVLVIVGKNRSSAKSTMGAAVHNADLNRLSPPRSFSRRSADLLSTILLRLRR